MSSRPRVFVNLYFVFPQSDPRTASRGRGTRTGDINEGEPGLFVFHATKFRLRRERGASLQFKRDPGRGRADVSGFASTSPGIEAR